MWPKKGTRVRIDACSMCQLRCPSCSTGKRLIADTVVGWGYLKAADLQRFLDANPRVEEVELSNCGEIFLNPEFEDILRTGRDHGTAMKAGNGVNLNTVSDSDLEAVVKYGLRFLSVSIDGASQEAYSQYRRGGDFDTVIRNVERINEHKERYGSELPVLQWQFVVMGHNEHELPKARKMAGSMNMQFTPKLSWDPDFSPVRDREFVRRESGLGAASRQEYRRIHGSEYLTVCDQMWRTPQINWDGKLLGCCKNIFGDYGANVFGIGLKEALTSERYVYAKRMLLGREPPRADIPCVKCDEYPRYLERSRHRGRSKMAHYLSLVRGKFSRGVSR